eukprot:10866512-Lingulodinium_polyedra.AAC.1
MAIRPWPAMASQWPCSGPCKALSVAIHGQPMASQLSAIAHSKAMQWPLNGQAMATQWPAEGQPTASPPWPCS